MRRCRRIVKRQFGGCGRIGLAQDWHLTGSGPPMHSHVGGRDTRRRAGILRLYIVPIAWFAVRTRSRAEKLVHDQLDRKDLECFLPTVTRWSRWKDRKKAIDWPLFPGYCFARFDPVHQLAVLKCHGVANIVSFAGELASIPELEIESLRKLVTSELKYDPVPFIKEGMMVEVVHGPLTGVVGRLVRKGERARLVLCVDLIGQAVSAQVDAADVRPY